MAKRRTEVVAASLLSTWTDADTSMQIVGSSLGIFGTGRVDPAVVLSDETPLRNALFDVLLSLVEGGALEMRTTDDGHYAFRWRDDVETVGIAPETSTTIDLNVPSPHLEELTRIRAERDEAIGRADLAEALAAERERLLRLAGVPSPSEPVAAVRELSPETRDDLSMLETRDESILDALYASRQESAHQDSGRAQRRTAASSPPKKAKRVAKATKTKNVADDRTQPDGSNGPDGANEVVYLPSSAATEKPAHVDLVDDDDGPSSPRRKWSGYAIDKVHPHLASVDRLVEDG